MRPEIDEVNQVIKILKCFSLHENLAFHVFDISGRLLKIIKEVCLNLI